MKKVINEIKLVKSNNTLSLKKVENHLNLGKNNVIVRTEIITDNSAPHTHNIDDISITSFQLAELDSILYS